MRKTASAFFGIKPSLRLLSATVAVVFTFAINPGSQVFASEIAAGGEHSLVLGANGAAWAWGENSEGELGLGHQESQADPQPVSGGQIFQSVTAGKQHSFGLAADGRLFAWGRNGEGQLGVGDFEDRAFAVQVGVDLDWMDIAAGAYHTIAIKGGKLFSWGANSAGQLGTGSYSTVSAPVQIGGDDNWIAVAAGEIHSMAIREDHTLWVWGSNLEGQLGLASAVLTEPTQVGLAGDWEAVAAGAWHSLALKTDGTLWSWGRNLHGQTGLGGGITRQATPAQVGSETNWLTISAGDNHNAALQADQTLWTWGANGNGELGDGTSAQRWTPVRIEIDGFEDGWIGASAGGGHTLVLHESGALYASGLNTSGQLGNGTVQSDPDLFNSFGLTLLGQPDLEIATVSLPDPNPLVDVDAPFVITVAGVNAGSGAIPVDIPFSIELRLTNSASWGDADDLVLGSFEIAGGLAIGEAFSEDLEVTLTQPVAAGDYYVAAALDEAGEVDESDEGNNRGWSDTAVSFLSDLRVGILNESLVSVEAGQELTVEVPVRNDGTGTLGAGDLDVTLTLATIPGVDDLLWSRQSVALNGVPAKTSTVVSVTATVPFYVAPGSYHLSVELDDGGLIAEANEANNGSDSVSAFIEVGGISLAEALTQPDVDFVRNAGVSWFGREGLGQNDGDAASSPLLSVGEEAWFQTEVATNSTVTFRWRADTRHEDNRLVFSTIDGVVVYMTSISGETDWERVSLDVSAGTVLQWTYVKGADTEGDIVFIEGLQITEQNLPDFAVIGAVYEAGNYVLQRDGERLEITATGINLGAVAPLPPGFKMSAYLSASPVVDSDENVFLGDLTLFRNLDANNRFVYRSSLPLPDSLSAGAYYLVLVVDSGNAVVELDADNNSYISAAPDIVIERRANLRVTGLDYAGDLYLASDEISFELTLMNEGLEDVPAGLPFNLSLFVSEVSEVDPAAQVELVTFQESLGIAAGESVTYEITVPVPAEIPLGQLQFAAASVDVSNAVLESNELDNDLFSPLPNLIFGQVSVEEALDVEMGGEDVFLNAAGGSLPWFGQTEASSDGEDAAQSPALLDGEEAAFELAVEVPATTVVSFFWSVSSERVEVEDAVKEDYLAFFIDGVEQARVSGEVGWEQESVVLSPGSRTLAWRYIKDGSVAEGADTAWVDHIVYRMPDLMVSTSPSADAANLFAGEPLTIDFAVSNGGLGASPPFEAELVLSLDRDFGNAQNIPIETFSSDSLAPDEIRALTRTVNLPTNLPVPGNYYIGLRLDGRTLIPESNEGNNAAWSDLNNLVVSVPVTLEEAIDLEELNPTLDLALSRGGDALWFGQEDEFYALAAGNLAGGKTPTLGAGEEAWFEMTVAGPAMLEFQSKAETAHVSNFLEVSVDGSDRLKISGSEDWTSQRILLPAASNVVRWTYVQGVIAPGVAYVDRVQVSAVTQPDFLIQSVDYAPGEYVLTRNDIRITALGSNQGIFAEIDSDFKVTAKLVTENTPEGFAASSIVLGDLEQFEDLDADNRFVYQANLPIPTTTPAGNYYLALMIDTNQTEIETANNYFFSINPDIDIVRLPDLVVEDVVYPGGSFIYGEEMQLSFSIRNQGLADLAAQPFPISVLLSPDRTLNPAGDDLLIQFTETSGLPRGQQRTYQITVEIPDNVRTGEPLNLGVFVDATNAVRESLDGNNTRLSDSQALVGELLVDVAVDNLGKSFTFGNIPWFGQSGDSFDGQDAARSGKAGDGKTSSFETTVNLSSPSILSFYWKVSSERMENPESEELKEDFLKFSINGIEQERISGEVDWARASFALPAGSSVLSWEYVKDLTLSAGDDAGWVDEIRFELPDLIVETVDYLPGNYTAGQTFPFSARIRNQGLSDVPLSPAFNVQFRLSRNNIWGDEDDIQLDTVSVSGLAMDSSRTLTRSNVTIPADIPFVGAYYIGAMIDFGDTVAESNDLNNTIFSASPDIELTPSVTLAAALDNDEYSLDEAWVDTNWDSRGNKTWFGQADRELTDGTNSTFDSEDAAQSGSIGAGEVSVLEREIEVLPTGPAVITFQWKVSSMANANFLRFSISGTEVARISGERDWEEVSLLVPSGPQVLRWEYVKTNAQVIGEDAGFLDRVEILGTDQPDLVITEVEYQPGEYVLDRDDLPLQVTVQNRGADLVDVTFLPSDLGVRLSVDRIWGNADDIILGNFARVDEFESGNRLVFSGELELPDHAPDGTYYLSILADPFKRLEDEQQLEFDRDNNFFWSDSQTVEVLRLPDLTIDSWNYDWEKVYFPRSTVLFDFDVVNSGLGTIEGGTEFAHEVQLYGRLVEDGADPLYNWIESGTLIEALANVPENAYMPSGASLAYQTHLMLPNELVVLNKLGIVGDEFTASMVTDAHRVQLADWEFTLVVSMDVDDEIAESDETNTLGGLGGLGLFSIAPVLVDEPETLTAWALRNGVDEAVQESKLINYAFNLNPNEDGATMAFPTGFIEVDGEEYYRITFDVVQVATDLVYDVEVSMDSINWDHHLTLDLGNAASEPRVVSVADQGYTAAVTVRDSIPVDELSARFYRVRVTHIE